ncbi:MAG: hypothetical protein IPH89_04925 [Bacteroidetes bacterium]|nr:hypothetical protein [Bacteroidota bacterium]
MITLRKTEQVEIYQVELALKEKTKQSPFIAVLILAQEQGEITAETLKDYLLPTLPIRACNNLLIRLTQQGYLEKKRQQNFRNNIGGHSFYNEEDENDYNGSVFTLTELGEQSAIDKSFWVGEKGIYNVYVSHSNLLSQQIIKTEKVDRSEDDRNGNRITRTPHFISQYHNQILNLNRKEIRIEEIEDKCFQLKPLECSLEIETKEDEALIRIKENQSLFQTSYEINENELKEELLSNTNEFDYDESKKLVLSEFNQDNISFNRKVKLRNSYFQNNQFNSVEIENISFIPSDKRNAELWLNEILFKGIDKYFLDDKSFNEYAANKAKPILEHYRVELPTRKQLKQTIAERENAFYQTAKLETIDYLNY